MHVLILEAVKNSDFPDVELTDLADIRDVSIDTSVPLEDRARSFAKQIKNPYCFRHIDKRVRVSFTNNNVSLGDLLKQYILSKQRLEFVSLNKN